MTKEAEYVELSTASATFAQGRYFTDPVKVPAPDTIPDQWTFDDETGVATGSTRTSNTITVQGLGPAVSVVYNVTGSGGIDKNGNGVYLAAQTLTNGDTFKARHTASGSASSATNTIVTAAPSGVTDTFRSVTAGTSGSWQLDPTEYTLSLLPLEIIKPRPDDETNVWARCRRAPAGEVWTHPIEIVGGDIPAHVEIINGGGSGVTVGEDWHDDNYMVLQIDNPVIGTYTITFRVTTQTLVTADRTITLTVLDKNDTNYFIWLDAVNGNDANPGTFVSPKQTLNGWYLNTYDSAATHAGKQVHYRTGTYNLNGITRVGSSLQQVFLRSNKPFVHCAREGETVTWDQQNLAYFRCDNTQVGDFYTSGLTHINVQVQENGVPRKQVFRMDSQKRRFTAFRNVYNGGGPTVFGTDGSNSSAIMLTGGDDNYATVTECDFIGCEAMMFVLMYNTHHAAISRCRVPVAYTEGNNPAWGFFIKGNENSYISITDIECINVGNTRPVFHMSSFTAHSKDHIELRYINCKQPAVMPVTLPRSAGGLALGQGDYNVPNAIYGQVHIYRCNLAITHMEPENLEDGPWLMEACAIEHDGTTTGGITLVNSPEVTRVAVQSPAINQFSVFNNLTATTGLLHPTTNLLMPAYEANRYTHGCEVPS